MRFLLSPKTFKTALLLVLIIAAGFGYWRYALYPFESTDNAYLKAHITLISPKESGYVSKVLIEDNQRVQAGDLLVEIHDRDFQAKVTQAKAQLALEKAHIQTLVNDKQTRTAQIRQETANIAAAEADLERTSKDLKRFRNLAAAGAVSVQSEDAAEAAHKQATAHLDKAQSAHREAESQLAALDAQIAESHARIEAAEAALELTRIDLDNTRIVAPLSGVIGNRRVQVGQLVKPGSALAYLIPSDSLFVEANFKETQIGDMKPGQSVTIAVDAYPNKVFEGVVDSFAPASGSEFSLLPPENATGNFTKIVRRVPIKIKFKPSSDLNLLRPGLSTVVKVKVH